MWFISNQRQVVSSIFSWKLLILILKTHHDMRVIIVPLSIDLMWQIFLINLLVWLLFSIILLNHLLPSLYLRSTLLLIRLNSTNIILPWCNNSFFGILRANIIVLMPFLRSYPIQIRIGLSRHPSGIVFYRSVERNLNPPILVSYNG